MENGYVECGLQGFIGESLTRKGRYAMVRMLTQMWMGFLFVWFWAVTLCAIGLMGCAAGTFDGATHEKDAPNQVAPSCTLEQVQDPLRGRGALTTYNGREFLSDGVHLGWDIDLAEGTGIYPVGCGVVRVARAARGYGTLVVVIEHQLAKPLVLQNGAGTMVSVERFLTIYGHLRPTRVRGGRGTTALQVGQLVSSDTVLGYVEHTSLNGDGAEHLHLGVRLQSAVAAQQSDPSAWFRGYDGSPSQKRWFANARTLLLGLQEPTEQPTTSTRDSGVMQPPAPMLMARDAGMPLPPPPPVVERYRYAFRIRSSLRITPPYALRDQWWTVVRCENTGREEPFVSPEGFAECDAPLLPLFDGSSFVPDHPEWGDRGQIATVGNSPRRCTYTEGAEWRITRLRDGHLLYAGPVSGLRCVAVGSQDRLVFPN